MSLGEVLATMILVEMVMLPMIVGVFIHIGAPVRNNG
jgi:hypothetical protein